MATERVDLLELLRKRADGGDLDFLREAVAVLAEAVMDAEVTAQIGGGHGERSEARTTRRNGYRPRCWDTRAGTIELQIPKLRQGSYFPAPRRARLPRGRAAGVRGGCLHPPRRRPGNRWSMRTARRGTNEETTAAVCCAVHNMALAAGTEGFNLDWSTARGIRIWQRRSAQNLTG